MEEQMNRVDTPKRFRTVLVLMGLVFSITLAVIVANRLSDEALAVLAGAVCGVGAAIPTSLLVVAVTQKRRGKSGGDRYHDEEDDERNYRRQQQQYPPVVVVAPPGGYQPQRSNPWQSMPPALNAPIERQFKIVGGTSSSVDEEVENYEYYD